MDVTILDLARSGLQAQQTRVDFVSHNLANQQTPGFRALRPELVDLPADQNLYGVPDQSQITLAGDPTQGASVAQIFEPDLPGPTVSTGATLDVALPDGVYLGVQLPNGQTAYTRDGQITVAADGTLQVGERPITGNLRVPAGAGTPYVDARGQVLVNGAAGPRTLGTLPLVRIPNPEEMANLGLGLASPTVDSGAPRPATTADLSGLIRGALEGSNVQLDQELTHLIRAQRAYQANTKVLTTWDQLTGDSIQELGHS